MSGRRGAQNPHASYYHYYEVNQLQAVSTGDTEFAGTLLWKASLGAQIVSGPITYAINDKQYVATISGLSLCVFGLRE